MIPLRSFLQGVFTARHSSKEKLVFLTFTILCMAGELISINSVPYLALDPNSLLMYNISLAISASSFLLAGMTGLLGELLYFVIFLILPFTPLGATDLFAPLSMFFIFIHLVVQHRTVLGLAYFLGSHLPNLWSANLSFSELIINLLIIDPIVVLVAFAFRYIHDQSQINARKAQESKKLERRLGRMLSRLCSKQKKQRKPLEISCKPI